MPIAKPQPADPALEAQVFWLKHRKEFLSLLAIALVAISVVTVYRVYRERRETAASAMFSSARTANDYVQVISRYGDTSAGAAAYLLLANIEREERKFPEANATLQTFVEKFPQHELVSTARMAIAADLEALGKEDEALAMYQLIASTDVGSFTAPHALLTQARILQTKNRIEDARRICETIMTKYRDSYAGIEAARLLRTLKPSGSQNPGVGTASSSSATPVMPAPTPPASPGAKP
jgi:predicted negative regulator of RcsB-dependent stress response